MPALSCRCLSLLVLALVAGCEAKLSVDLTGSPVDSAAAVVLGLTGVTLLTDGASTVSLPLGETRYIDLLDYRSGNTLRLVSGEKVGNARYVGVALNFADGTSYVERLDGGTVPLRTPTVLEFADVDLSLGDDDEETLVLDLNLRFSLREDTATGSYALRPVLRVARSADTGIISGVVSHTIVESDDCRAGRSLTSGVAVYVFRETNATPTDYTGPGTALDAVPVELDADSGLYRYSVHWLSGGSYTLALTCQADRDTPNADEMSFKAQGNVTLDAGEAASLNFL